MLNESKGTRSEPACVARHFSKYADANKFANNQAGFSNIKLLGDSLSGAEAWTRLQAMGPHDDDNDGVPNEVDNCPTLINSSQTGLDGDDIGDLCDPDVDYDQIPNEVDNCPVNYNPDQANLDGDLEGDICDPDLDGDGVLNNIDNCPSNANADQKDSSGDGVGDVCEPETCFVIRGAGHRVISICI